MVIRELPIFPLPLVLFPGALLPLHVFEERYKLMLTTILNGDKLFGINFIEPEPDKPESEQAETVGCVAEVTLTVPLGDGRMNILVLGRERYRIINYTTTTPYHTAAVSYFEDEPEPIAESDELPRQVRESFARLNEVATKLSSAPLLEGDLPDAPAPLSFLVASALPIENKLKQALLESTSPTRRLQQELILTDEATKIYERRLLVQNVSHGNGHVTKSSN